jgi:hypothetical protein
MAGHSHPKDGVAFRDDVPAIHAFAKRKTNSLLHERS